MSNITITQALIGTKRILGQAVTISGTKNNDDKPEANGTQMTSVITQSFENPKYVISGIRLTDTSVLTYNDILALYTMKYSGSNPATLLITYNTSSVVPSLTSSTAGAKVILDSYSINYDTSDSRNAYIPIATLTFVETL